MLVSEMLGQSFEERGMHLRWSLGGCSEEISQDSHTPQESMNHENYQPKKQNPHTKSQRSFTQRKRPLSLPLYIIKLYTDIKHINGEYSSIVV